MERSRDWMMQAEVDLEHARKDLNDGFYEWACFSAQQSAEKAVKALFNALNSEAYGHNIAGLLKRLPLRVPEELIEKAKELDKFYLGPRYPNMHAEGIPHEHYTKAEAERAISYAEEIIKFCKSNFPK